MQIQVRGGQFRKCDAASHRKRTAGEFAAEPLQGQRVTRKVEPALEICQRRQRRIAKPGEVHSHVAGAGENGATDRPAQIYIQRHVAIEFLNRRHKLSQEIDGTSRQPDFCAKWRGLIQLPFAQNLCRVERQVRCQFHRLNFGLLQLA